MVSRLWLFLRSAGSTLVGLILITIPLSWMIVLAILRGIRRILGLKTKGIDKIASLFTALQIPFDEAIPTVALFLG